MTNHTRWLGLLIALRGVAARINATPLPDLDTTIVQRSSRSLSIPSTQRNHGGARLRNRVVSRVVTWKRFNA
jgi:hypothetical protein